MSGTIILTAIDDSIKDSRRVTALKATINDKSIDLPLISPWQKEIERARNRGMTIKSPSVTFLEHVKSPDKFIKKLPDKKQDYERFADENANYLINYSFDLHPNYNMSVQIRDAIREVQIEAKSQFLFEYEADINQDVSSLIKQLEQAQQWLSRKKSAKILVPVIDMKITDEDLFLAKLNALSKFRRINVIYQSPKQAPAQWGYLQKFLKENKIWCHMDCVLNRYNEDKISHRVSLYALGISSSSIAYSFGGGDNTSSQSIYEFNRSTLAYKELEKPYLPSVADKKDRVWINSLNAEIAELQTMCNHVKMKTFFTKYISTKQNLLLYLQAFLPK